MGNGLNPYSIWFHFVEALTICSVDIFVLISGYFLCTQRFKPSRIIKLAFAVLFYSVGWFLILTYVFQEPIARKALVKAFLPISYNQYWFISAYIGMYLLSPVINVLLRSLNQRQHLGTILLLLAMFSLWPDMLPYANPLGISSKGYTMVWFVVLFIIAAYIRKYPMKIKPANAIKYYILTALVLLAIWIVIALAIRADSFEDEWYGMFTFYYYRYNSLLVLTTAIFLFLTFINIKIENSFAQKAIAFVAPLTMGVYLIHDNENARDIVWKGLCGLEPTIVAPLLAIGYVTIVFFACLLIDEIRSLLFTLINRRSSYKTLMEKIDALPERISRYIYIKSLTI